MAAWRGCREPGGGGGRGGKDLEPPATFSSETDPQGLMPPSHFETKPQSAGAGPQTALSQAKEDIQRLKRENERLRGSQRKADRNGCRCLKRTGSDLQDVCSRTGLEREDEARREISHQADVIARQGQELQRLATEIGSLRRGEELRSEEAETLRGQLEAMEAREQVHAGTLASQREQERERERRAQGAERQEALREERHRLELQDLQEEWAGRLEEMREASWEQTNRLEVRLREQQEKHKAEVTELGVTYSRECSAQRESARQSEERGRLEVELIQEQLEEVVRERDVLQEAASTAEQELNERDSLVRQLRTYIGQLVPDEVREAEGRKEREALSRSVKSLEKERETLKATAELLNVRLTALTDILTLQEAEQAQSPRASQKPALLTRWREKVFALMVQLKSQEMCHAADGGRLRAKIHNLEEELRSQSQDHSVLLRTLQARAAELDMERLQKQTLREELRGAQDVAGRLQDEVDRDGKCLQQLKDVVGSYHQRFLEQEAGLRAGLSGLGNLSHRITFANKRIHTVQALVAQKDALIRLQLRAETKQQEPPDMGRRTVDELETEVKSLNEERDRLATELKRNAQLIERKVTEAGDKFEADLREQRSAMEELRGELGERIERQEGLEAELADTQHGLEGAQQRVEKLTTELARQREQDQQELQEKVREAESCAAACITDLEKRLEEVRREHTKAVVSLRQVERRSTRERERERENAERREKDRQRDLHRLQTHSQELERDRNLLMATLRQEGLMGQVKRNRLSAKLSTRGSAAGQEEGELSASLSQNQAGRDTIQGSSEESLESVLEELTALTAAVLGNQEENEL